MNDMLQQIRDLQYHDQGRAEALLLAFMRENLPYDVASVALRPSAVSLNSFNGFMTLQDGGRLFFKSHTEAHTVISEYYNAELLAQSGYPVIQPLYRSTEPGKQMLVYEVISDPSVFDVAWQIETGQGDESLLADLTQAQAASDQQLFQLYQATLRPQTAEAAAEAPIHQLFYHRLVGGRLDAFYGAGTQIVLPAGTFAMADVRRWQWLINGQRYDVSLDALIAAAAERLHPAQAGAAIVGHGDAHNGNVFFMRESQHLTYFDPAFAGLHSPLLDLVKPLFHNVFAMWMYFPQEKRASTKIAMQLDTQPGQAVCVVDYDYDLPAVRHMFLQSKATHTLVPILRLLQASGALLDDWRTHLKLALFCCPFLTMNLADHTRFPPEISLLGLAMAVEMGAESHGQRSLIDQTLNDVASSKA